MNRCSRLVEELGSELTCMIADYDLSVGVLADREGERRATASSTRSATLEVISDGKDRVDKLTDQLNELLREVKEEAALALEQSKDEMLLASERVGQARARCHERRERLCCQLRIILHLLEGDEVAPQQPRGSSEDAEVIPVARTDVE
jgi:hypothetical protein